MSLTINDATGNSRTIRTVQISSEHVGAHYNAAATADGATPYYNINLGTTGQIIKASPGQVYGIHVFNAAYPTPSGTQERFLKFYNKATAPTSGDTPVMSIPLESGVAMSIQVPACGIAFSAGISVRATTGIADNDNNAPGTNEVSVNILYA